MRDKRRIMPFMLLLSVTICSFFFSTGWMQTGESNEKLKVGFFEFEGYHIIDEEGKKSGYGYEYLQEMAKYNNWIFEYVGYERNWSEMLDMLDRGEIDILTSAQKTPEREAKFDFSSNSIGTSASIFTVKAGNMQFLPGDFESYNGIRVGMLEGNSRNESFEEYAKSNGFTYEPIYFNSTDQMTSELQSGTGIDAIITSNLRAVKNEWVLAQFDPSPFYVIVKKGNQKLLEEVNYAIEQVKLYNSNLPEALSEKYYSSDSDEKIAFTPQEQEYIKELRENNVYLSAIMNPDRDPFSYFENGQPRGIMASVVEEIENRTGLLFKITETSAREDYLLSIDTNINDIIVDARLDFDYAEKRGYKLTEPYFDASIALLSLKSSNGTVDSVAVVKDADITERYLRHIYMPHQLFYYNSMEECVEAVKKGRQDCTYLYTYSSQKFLLNDEKNQLKETLLPNYITNFCFAVKNSNDPRLLTILNKAVKSINQDFIREIILSQTTTAQKNASLLSYIYDNPIIMMLTVGIFFALIFLLILYIYSIYHRKIEREKSEEFERFISYVCKANDEVLEADFNNKKCLTYKVEEGRVLCQETECMPLEMLGSKIHEEDLKKISSIITINALQQLMEQEKELTLEFRMKANMGEYCWYSYTFQGIKASKNTAGKLMIFAKNIDDLKREDENIKQILQDALEVARQASAAKGNFMSRMSHEIRTPLNAVIGYMNIAQEEENKDKIKNYITKAGFAAHHLLNIINDVLDISSIESGKMKIAKEDFDFKQLINTLTSIFHTQCQEKGIQLKVSIKELTDEWLVGDPLRLNQVLMNLLSNAVKFTPKEGIIRMDITQKNSVGNKRYITIVVSDTGIGMTKDFMKHLFSPFEQQDASIAQKHGGTGLGLSIAKNLVNMMNGTIHAESEEGKGTAFTISICFEKSGKNEALKNEFDFSKINVLIVDNDEGDCQNMQEVLKRCNVKGEIMTSAADAVTKLIKKAATNHPYDICLFGWYLSEMSGSEFSEKVLSECGDKAPILITMAYDVTEIMTAAKGAGVAELIAKPIFQSTMFDILVNTYGKYKQKEEPLKENVKTEDLVGIPILLAEDNEMNLEIALSILGKAGLVIDSARDGEEAYQKFVQSKEGAYSAILMDVQMPIMDGYEATRAIRNSQHPQAKEIPIIAMTANAFAEDIAAAIASGMNDHIAKPIHYQTLFNCLKKLLATKGDGNHAE